MTRAGASAASAVAIVYLCLLQVFLWGLAQGSMATVAFDPQQVICSAAGGPEADGSGGPTLPDRQGALTCPLCALSRVATTGFAAPEAPCPVVGRVEPGTLVRARPPHLVPSSLLRVRTADARAPPPIS